MSSCSMKAAPQTIAVRFVEPLKGAQATGWGVSDQLKNASDKKKRKRPIKKCKQQVRTLADNPKAQAKPGA